MMLDDHICLNGVYPTIPHIALFRTIISLIAKVQKDYWPISLYCLYSD